jgi:hypothetical protein
MVPWRLTRIAPVSDGSETTRAVSSRHWQGSGNPLGAPLRDVNGSQGRSARCLSGWFAGSGARHGFGSMAVSEWLEWACLGRDMLGNAQGLGRS